MHSYYTSQYDQEKSWPLLQVPSTPKPLSTGARRALPLSLTRSLLVPVPRRRWHGEGRVVQIPYYWVIGTLPVLHLSNLHGRDGRPLRLTLHLVLAPMWSVHRVLLLARYAHTFVVHIVLLNVPVLDRSSQETRTTVSFPWPTHYH